MRRLLPLALFGVLVLAACGSDDAKDEAATTTTEAPATTAVAEPVQVPDFPIPAPDGATRVANPEEGLLELEYPIEDAERVVAFYVQWTSDQGSWTQTEELPEGIIADFLSDTTQSGIAIFDDLNVVVLLSYDGG